jgi:phosphoribosylglycinamide formyltransferase-1
MSNGKLALEKNVNAVNIAIYASGGGTNAKKIIEYFKTSLNTKISLVVCNKPTAGVLQIARLLAIPILLIEKESFLNGNGYMPTLQQHKIDFIILAGFLWKIPPVIIKAYPKKIINIHPALLPKYGGKGMYGQNVHEAVIAAKETQSGITIHFVDEVYDDGEIIFQATCPVTLTDTAQTLATKIKLLEHIHYAPTIASVLPKQR